MTKQDALYNSIFVMLGVAYKYNTDYIANIYRVPSNQFELWLWHMGFNKHEIKYLRRREPFGEGYCGYCGIQTETKFCSETCEESESISAKLLDTYTKTKYIKLTMYRNTYYNIITGKVERVHND